MPTKRLPTKTIRSVCDELLANKSYRAICKELKLSIGAVTNIATRVYPEYDAAISNGEWIDDRQLSEWMYPKPPDSPDLSMVDYYERAGLPLSFIHAHSKLLGISTSFSYSHLCTRLTRLRTEALSHSVTKCKPGKICFIRDGGVSLVLADDTTGRLNRYEVMVGILPASGYCVMSLYKQDSLFDLVEALQGMLNSFGAVPQQLDITLSTSPKPDLKAFDAHYGTKTVSRLKARKSARPGEPLLLEARAWVASEIKGKLPRGVDQVKGLLNTVSTRWNQQLMPEYKEHIANAFLELDRQHMKELPCQQFTFCIEKEASVGLDNHIKYKDHHYSVPYWLIGKRLRIVITVCTIRAYADEALVAEHPHRPSKGYSTTERHMYNGTEWDDKREYTPQRLIRWARKFGPDVARWAKRRLDCELYPEHAFRSVTTYLSRGQDQNFSRLMNKQCKQANLHGRLNPQR